ncbi:MAG TPA: cytochrome P450 [Gaiellales bacterium]|jgi:cytochrome P450|nr:cytochrome P450 [Gaiellales bacterium]
MTLSIDTADVPSFDISDPFFSASSAAVAAAREQSWWARTNFGLAVLRYDEVSALLKDRRLRQGSFAWPAQNGIEQGLLSEWWAEIMLSKEGDDHRRLRKLANPAFSRTLIERMGPEFRALADELIDAYVAAGSCEFVSQFAEPYAARVLCKLIGMDEARWHDLSRWSTDLGLSFGVTIREHQGRIEDALQNLYAVSEELIADRRVRPRDDVVSSLVQAHDAEEGSLSDIELLAMVSLIVFGGMDTTKNQLGLAMQLFVEHPDQCALLAERPELAQNAVEELIRWNPTVMWATRRTTEDMEFGGLALPEGTTLHLLSYPANTDPLAVGEGGRFDIMAERPPHFGFGGGAHHCIGHWLARIDMREALPLIARRMPNPRYTAEPVVRPVSGLTGPVELPLAFDREGAE